MWREEEGRRKGNTRESRVGRAGEVEERFYIIFMICYNTCLKKNMILYKACKINIMCKS